MSEPLIVKNAESYDLDTREQLEADVHRAADEMEKFTYGEKFINTNKILRWLDRQAAITERELCSRCSPYATSKDYLDTIDELTAERDNLQAERDKMTAEVEKIKSELDNCEHALRVAQENRDHWFGQIVGIYKSSFPYEGYGIPKNVSEMVLTKIAELTAEVEKQRQRANEAERGALSDEWYVARDRYEDDVAALTAERDKYEVLAVNAEQWKDERDQLSKDLTAEHALVIQFEHDNEQLREHAADLAADAKRWADAANAQRLVAMEQTNKVQELTVERDELRVAIDAMENGQFYAMYRRACKERDELKREHEQERQQMQRIIDTQRESFRKMEFELAQAKGGDHDEG